MQAPVVVFGIGTFASVVAGYLGDRVYAFTVDAEYRKQNTFDHRPVVEFSKLRCTHPPKYFKLFLAVTQQNGHRELLRLKYEQAVDMGYSIATCIHPTAYVGECVEMEEGILISPHAIVESGTTLGRCTIVRSGAYVGHHCTVGDFVYVAPRASMSGHVTIEDGAFIGNNATLRDRIVIGENAVIGAGAVVLRNVRDNEVYKAIEARLLSIDARTVKI